MRLPEICTGPRCVSAGPGLMLALLLGVFLALDVITTHQILMLGGREMNVIMAPVVASPLLHAMLKLGFFGGALGWAAWCDRCIPESGLTILSALNGWFLFVFLFNLRSLSIALGLL